MSGASLPTQRGQALQNFVIVLIPDEWGKSSDQTLVLLTYSFLVLIPDEWGKSSDSNELPEGEPIPVLIPDEWGKSSDCISLKI